MKVESSVIAEVNYLESQQDLMVEFNNGATYVYHEVSQEVVDSFLSADSVGRYYTENIKDKFGYSKVIDA